MLFWNVHLTCYYNLHHRSNEGFNQQILTDASHAGALHEVQEMQTGKDGTAHPHKAAPAEGNCQIHRQ